METSDNPLKRTRLETDNNTVLREGPDFLIIGAQKCGTMAAVKNLNKHPDIFVHNEVHFFDLGWHSKTIESYKKMFQETNKLVCGEKTPELIYVDECISRMKSVCPNAKFILFLRDPIFRAYSSWNMNKSKSREDRPFDECIQANLDALNEYRSYGTAEYHYVQRGFYYEQIERFLKIFPKKEQLLIMIAERIRQNPTEEYQKIFEFLGVKDYKIEFEDDHIGQYKSKISEAMKSKLRKIYKPHNEKLFEYLGYRIEEWESNMNTKTSLPTNPLSSVESTGINNYLSEMIDCNEATIAYPSCLKTSDFAMIGESKGTDKITHHGYHRFYPRYLEHYRHIKGGGMLEIGVEEGKSIDLWLEYFPHSYIYGIDINEKKKGERYEILKADQSSTQQLRSVVEKSIHHPIFFIIDDGSHVPEHQISSFDYLFQEVLMPGGTYIIEDIETSYWTRNHIYGYPTRYGFHHENSIIEIFKDLVDDINSEFLTSSNKRAQELRVGHDVSHFTRRDISTITYGQNCIIITKKTSDERDYDDRRYRYSNNL